MTYSKKLCFLCCLLLLTGTALHAQTFAKAEGQMTASTGKNTPLWLNANKYGLSSLEKANGYLRAGLFHSMECDSLRRWAIGYGADVAIAKGFTSTVVIQQAYADVRWLKGLLTVGSKEQTMELKNQELSSGPQTLGINARPVPSVRLSLPDYWIVPYTRGWLGVKGHIAYGLFTDGNWQKDFVYGFNKRTENVKLHTKAGYLRFGKEQSVVTVELGLEMACQYGGTTWAVDPYATGPNAKEYVSIKNKDGLKGMLDAFIPGGGDSGEGLYGNMSGNHLGSYLMRINLNYDKWYLGLYADHFFEDHSQMFFLDYDGYGEGEEYNEWKKNRWLVYDLKDIMLGAELKLKEQSWLNDIVVEYLYTKYQSGPIYHDRTFHISDHIAGNDDYYNNYMQAGWHHWGQVMGNPLYRSPIYNDDRLIHVESNRFWAWHIGLSGDPTEHLHYRLLGTCQRSWGTYALPFRSPLRNASLLAEASYHFSPTSKLEGWSIKAALGFDHGELLGNNTGMQFTIGKRFFTSKK